MSVILENSDRGVILRGRILLACVWVAVALMVLAMVGALVGVIGPMAFWLDNALTGLKVTGSVAAVGVVAAALVGLWAARRPRVDDDPEEG